MPTETKSFYFAVRDPAEEVVVAIVKVIFERNPDDGDTFTWRGDFKDSVANAMDDFEERYLIDRMAMRRTEAETLEVMGVCPIVDVREA